MRVTWEGRLAAKGEGRWRGLSAVGRGVVMGAASLTVAGMLGNNSELPRPVGLDTAVPGSRASPTDGSHLSSGDSAPIYEAGMKDLDQLRRSVG